MSLAPLVVILVAIGADEPDPLDAFRANYASIKADADYTTRVGILHGDRESVWSKRGPSFAPEASATGDLVGHWGCDGTTEYFRFSSTHAILERAAKQKLRIEPGKAFFEIPFVPETEALWDGKTLVAHAIDRLAIPPDRGDSWHVLNAWVVDDVPGVVTDGRAPFYWGFTYTFPQIIEAQFAHQLVERGELVLGGRPTLLEVYRRGDPNERGCVQLEVAYDPAVGYLPRFARQIAYGGGRGAYIKDMYLVDARVCREGGFVPTDLFCVAYMLSDFDSRNYRPGLDLKPSRVGAELLHVGSLRDRRGPVALSKLNGVHTIAGIGGIVPIGESRTSLTLREAKTLLGPKLTNPPRTVTPASR